MTHFELLTLATAVTLVIVGWLQLVINSKTRRGIEYLDQQVRELIEVATLQQKLRMSMTWPDLPEEVKPDAD